MCGHASLIDQASRIDPPPRLGLSTRQMPARTAVFWLRFTRKRASAF